MLINFTGLGDPKRVGLINALIFEIIYQSIGNLAFIVLPASITLAMLRYRLWDVDIIIRRTLVYTSLTITLALIFFGGIILFQALFTAISGQQSAISIVISTLTIAALFNPLRKRIQNDIDRRFYRRKYNAQKTLERFVKTARNETDLNELTFELLSVIEEALQPQGVDLWIYKKTKS